MTAGLLLLILASCAGGPPPKEILRLTQVDFADLPGWNADQQSQALSAFRRSCEALDRLPGTARLSGDGSAGTAADWREPCRAASAVPVGDDSAARQFFETAFIPFAAHGNDEAPGLFTGYYEAELHGARRREGPFTTPILKRPADLVTVDLGLFRPALQGQRLAGRVEEGQLRPYASRAQINDGALAGRGLELFWVDDPVDAFFLEIQGSGRIILPDGSVVRVGYDGQNGCPYVPIGRVMAQRGLLPREAVTMQSIRAWLAAHPEEALGLMNENPSYVFFRALPSDTESLAEGPQGAEGVALTPGRSLAVDSGFLPLGAPVWLDARDPAEPQGGLRILSVAQDTGGAIRGPVRGDVFWGSGAGPAERAGKMKDEGSYYLLLPRALATQRNATS